MALFQNVQNLMIIGSTLNSVSGNQSNANNIAGPSSGNYPTIPAMTSTGSSPSVPLPAGNKGPRPPRLTTMFTGRRDILERLTQYFNRSKSSMALKTQKIFVLYGLGGTGKTSIMNKFVDQFSDRFGGIYYIDASTLATLQAGFEGIARNASAGQTVDDALLWLSQRQRNEWLLLLDNADDPSIDLRQFIPHCRHGNIIVTSRNQACRLYAPDSNCCVSSMDPDDATELLLKYAMVEPNDENRQLCATIARELGYLALAVAQAGAFISQTSCLNTYMRTYQKDRVKLLRKHWAQSTDDYKWTVYTTWEMSLKQLSLTASTFLRICAFLHHESISSKIFQDAALAEDPDDSFADAVRFLQTFKSGEGEWSHFRFLECIRELTSYSLIHVHSDGDLYSIHPLVHSWAKDRVNTGEREEGRNWAMQILALSIPPDESSDGYAFRRSLLPHVDAAHVGNIPTEIAERFSRVYRDCGRWNEAEELLKFVVETRKTELGMDDPKTLCSMNNLAITYLYQERWKEAEELGLEVVEAMKRLFGDEDIATLISKSGLASTYDGQGRLKEAETLHKEIWEATRKLFGDEDPDALISKHNLACTYADQGKLQEAETLEAQVLEARRRVLGDEHPFTLSSQTNLAYIYRDQGRLKEAALLLSKVVEASRRLLGDNHPDTQDAVRHLTHLPKTRATVLKDALRHPIDYLRRTR